MKNIFTKKEIKEIEDLGWSINKYDDYYELRNYSPCGADLTTEIKTKEDLISYCDNFDENEHFDLWYGVHRGEPTMPSDLWNDCLAIKQMYEDLSNVLKGNNGKEGK